ncbi:MAG: SIR2 family protein [Gemmatimonadota bacterium]|nr:SIR2 family protein [Gemmatimonadota bacterium]
MNDVFILGAGFSKAICPQMPTLKELTDEVIKRLWRSEEKKPPALAGLNSDIEAWITYLSQRQPWLREDEIVFNRYLAAEIRDQIGEIIRKSTSLASEQKVPKWLSQLIYSWHYAQTTIITLNYDTLVERATTAVMEKNDQIEIWSSLLYPRYLCPDGVRTEGKTLHQTSLETFKLLKFHGSINWYYSGREEFFGETIFFSEDLPYGQSDVLGPDFRSPFVEDKELLVIPPVADKSTYFNNESIKKIWRSGGDALRQADRVFFVGYSLPSSDLGMRFFLQRNCPEKQKVPIFLVNTDIEVLNHYKASLGWNFMDRFVQDDKPILNFVQCYPDIC